MTEEKFGDGLARLIEDAQDSGLSDEAIIAVLADAIAALQDGLA